MNIYIATKFENVEGFKHMQDLIEKAGHTLIYDWTQENFEKENHGMDFESFQRACAVTDVMAVLSCDTLIMLPTQDKMAGAFVELGLAIGKKQIIIVAPFAEGKQHCVFYYLPEVAGGFEIVNTPEEAIARLAPAVNPQSN